MKRTVRDYDLEATEYLLSRSDLDFTRREEGHSVQFIICQDGVELGRLTFSPVRPGFGGEVNIAEDSTAIGRGAHISMQEYGTQEYGTVVNIPDNERERHREFVAICKRIKSKVEFLHSARERHCSLTQDAEGCAGKKRKGAPRLEERPDADEKRRKARRYLERVKKGTPKEIAAELVGHSRKTLNRWVERLL